MKRRSFALPAVTESKLEDIKTLKNQNTMAEAMRYAIDFCSERILYKNQTDLLDELRIGISKIDVVLRFLLIEAVKTHGGQTNSGKAVQQYLATLNEEIAEYLQQTIEEQAA